MQAALNNALSLGWQTGAQSELFKHIGVALAIFMVFYLSHRFLAKEILSVCARLAKNTETTWDDQLVLAFRRPLQWFLLILGLYLALRYLPLAANYDLLVLKLFRTSLIVLVTLGFFNLAGSHELIGSSFNNLFGIQFEKILIPFLSKTLRVVIIGLGFSMMAGEWHYDVNGFVAGLGLGGLAFALAAQDTAANIFGGIVIITDKPFDIGDWIQTPSVEGTVEDINFRSTRIRTFNDSMLTVPNSTLAKEPITNRTRMGKRRINFTLSITYDTPKENLERSIQAMRQMLFTHEEIDQGTIFVRLDGFGPHGYEILIYFFTKATVWGEHLRVKEDVNYRIMDILAKEGAAIALPSTSIYLAGDAKREKQVNF